MRDMFIPSENLANIVALALPRPAFKIRPEDIPAAFGECVESKIARIAFRVQAKQVGYHKLDAEFVELLVTDLVLSFNRGVERMANHHHFDEFVSTLFSDLMNYVRDGGEIAGSWGRLVIWDGELALDIQARQEES